MAQTADQYQAEAEAALTKAKQSAGSLNTASLAQAQAYAAIASVYASLFEMTQEQTAAP